MKRFSWLSLIIMSALPLFVCAQPKSSKPGKYSSLTGNRYNSLGNFNLLEFDLTDDHGFLYKKHKSKPSRYGKIRIKGVDAGLEVGDGIYLDRTEVTNLAYLEYLFLLQRDSSNLDVFQFALPDTMVWNTMNQDERKIPGERIMISGPLVNQYFRMPEYRFFPVVGINFMQAKEFCKWKGEYLTKKYGLAKGIQLKGRLPLEAEFISGVEQFLSHAKTDEDVVSEEGDLNLETIYYDYEPYISQLMTIFQITQLQLAYNFPFEMGQYPIPNNLNLLDDDYWENIIKMPFYVYSLNNNDAPIFHILGNVEEWCTTEGEAALFGGGYLTEYAEKLSREAYSADFIGFTSSQTGFRCVIETMPLDN